MGRTSQLWRRVYLPMLVGALGATIMAFMASTYFTARRGSLVMDWSEDIATNAMPSVVHLSNMRAHVRRIERELDRAAAAKPSDALAVESSLSSLRFSAEAYLRTPNYPGEEASWAESSNAIDSFRRAVEHVRALVAAADLAAAQRAVDQELHPTAEIADARLGETAALNARAGEVAGRHMQSVQTSLTTLAYAFDVLSLGVALAVGAFAAGVMRRHARFAEERAGELEQFANRVAHDLRAPLSPLLLSIESAARHEVDDTARRSLDRATRSIHRLVEVIDALLEFARAGARPPADAVCELRPVVDGVIEDMTPLAAAKDVSLDVSRLPNCSVACSQGVLASILANLVRNAVTHMDASRPERGVTIRAVESRARVRFEVEDTGMGLPPGLGETIFEPYVRGQGARAEGLGLGLAIVKRLVEAHGGSVGAQSRNGAGALFWFELPVRPVHEPAARSQAKAAQRA